MTRQALAPGRCTPRTSRSARAARALAPEARTQTLVDEHTRRWLDDSAMGRVSGSARDRSAPPWGHARCDPCPQTPPPAAAARSDVPLLLRKSPPALSGTLIGKIATAPPTPVSHERTFRGPLRRSRPAPYSTIQRPLEVAHAQASRAAASCPARPAAGRLRRQADALSAAQDGYGYSEQRIEENRYRVSFAGNSATSRQTVEDYLLYRAAELTVQTGHDWFEVVDRDTVQEYSGYGGSPRWEWASAAGPVVSGSGCPSRCSAGRRRAQLHGGHGHPRARRREAAGNPNAYDAFAVISRLQPKILAGGSLYRPSGAVTKHSNVMRSAPGPMPLRIRGPPSDEGVAR